MASPARLSAGVVVVRDTEDGARFLLLRAYRNWDFPKGLVQPGEEPLTAALREVREETGIDDLDFPWGQAYADTQPYSGGKVARYYLGRTRTAEVEFGVNPEIGRPEHHEYRWVDLTEALDLSPPRLKPIVSWAAGKVMEEYKTAH